MFKLFSVQSRQHEVMARVSTSPVTFKWKQVIHYTTIITGGSVEQSTVSNLYYVRQQDDLICIVRCIGLPNEGFNPI